MMFDVVSGNIYLTLPNRHSNVSGSAPTQDNWKTTKVKQILSIYIGDNVELAYY
jgi:hypothetical protein